MIRVQEKKRGARESQYQSYYRSLFLVSLNMTASSAFFFLSRTLFSSCLSFTGFIFFHLALFGDVSQSQQANSTGCGHKPQPKDKDGEKGDERADGEEKALKISVVQALSSIHCYTVTRPQQPDRIFLFITSFLEHYNHHHPHPSEPKSLIFNGTQFPRNISLISWKTIFNRTP